MKNKVIKTLAAILSIIMILGSAQAAVIVMAEDFSSDKNILEESPDLQDEFSDDIQQYEFNESLEALDKDEISQTDEVALLSDMERPELISRSEVEANGHVSRLEELEESLNSIVLHNLDGTNTTYIFSEPVKYVDAEGIIHDKKTGLFECEDEAYKNNYSYTNSNNDVRVYFPKTLSGETGIILKKNDINIELTPVSSKKIEIPLSEHAVQSLESKTQLKEITAQTTSPIKRQIDKNVTEDSEAKDVIDYNAVFGNRTALRYTTTLNGFKEDIVLNSYDGTNEFVFRLKTNGLRLVNKDGIYYLAEPETSEIVVTMGELIVYSNGGTDISNGYEHRYAAETVTENEEYLLTVIVDKNFLLSEDTKYPVIIDPSFEVLSENNNIMDVSVRATGSVISSSQNNAVGNHYTEKKDMRTFIKFPGLLNDPIFQDLAPYGLGGSQFPEVQSIKLMMYSRGTSQVTGQVRVYPYNTSSALDWTYNTTSFTTAQYNAAGNQWTSTAVPYGFAQWVEFDITQAASVSCDKGIVLRNQYEGDGNDPAYQSFASTKDLNNKPKIVVNWSAADNTSFDKAANMSLNSFRAVDISTAGSKRYYSFTPSSTGFYTFQSSNNGTCDPLGKLYNSAQVNLAQNDDGAGGRNFNLVYYLEANNKYYFEAGCYSSGTGTYSLKVSASSDLSGLSVSAISTSAAGTASITEQYQKKYFTLTPATSGSYTIESSATSGDPRGWLYNSSGTKLTDNDDGAENKNFSMTYMLTAGVKYYVVAGCYGSGTGSYSINVSVDIPEPPTNLTVSDINSNSVYLAWSVASNHRADRWLIQYRTSGGSWTNAETSTSKHCTVSGLTAYTTYEFRVYSEAGSPAWSGTWSSASNTVTATTLPKQPTNLTSDINSDSVYLTWSVASNHRADRWLIQYRTSGGSWTNAGTSTSKHYTVSGLTAYTTYEFRVYSEAGPTAWSGTWSKASNTVTATTLPKQPTNLTASDINSDSVYLAWSVASNHRADRWLIQYRTSGGSWTNAETSTSKHCTVSGLTAYTTYEFRVYSEAGPTAWSGTWSKASNTVTATTLPKQPTNLTANNYSANSVYLAWSVASNHRADRWLIQYRTSGGSWTNAGTSTSKHYTVSGLSANTTYEFRVYSEAGPTAWSGTWSKASNTVTITTGLQKVHPIDISLGQGITYPGHQVNARDFGASEGTPIYAAMAGEIVTVVMSYNNDYNIYYNGPSGEMNEYGNYIDIRVWDGTIMRYAHQQKTSLSGIYVGATVYAGQQIGKVGNTGYSNGAHLHLETIGSGNILDYFQWQ